MFSYTPLRIVNWCIIKQIFHSSSKNKSDMALGVPLHILLAVVEYLLITRRLPQAMKMLSSTERSTVSSFETHNV